MSLVRADARKLDSRLRGNDDPSASSICVNLRNLRIIKILLSVAMHRRQVARLHDFYLIDRLFQNHVQHAVPIGLRAVEGKAKISEME